MTEFILVLRYDDGEIEERAYTGALNEPLFVRRELAIKNLEKKGVDDEGRGFEVVAILDLEKIVLAKTPDYKP